MLKDKIVISLCIIFSVFLMIIMIVDKIQKEEPTLTIQNAENKLDEMMYLYFLGGNGNGRFSRGIGDNSGHVDYFNDRISLVQPNNNPLIWHYYRESNYAPARGFGTIELWQLKEFYRTNKHYTTHYKQRAVNILLKQLNNPDSNKFYIYKRPNKSITPP